jgi:hypothetical protein
MISLEITTLLSTLASMSINLPHLFHIKIQQNMSLAMKAPQLFVKFKKIRKSMKIIWSN